LSQDLPARAKALRAQLTRIRDLESRVREAGGLADLQADLAKPVAALAAQLDQRAVLTAAGIDVDLPLAVVQGRHRAAGLLDAFAADRTAATLKKGRGWTQVLSDTDAAAAAIAAAVKAAWQSHQHALFGGDAPNTIRTRLARTPENNAALRQYEADYAAFRQAVEAPPRDAAAVRQAQILAEALRETAKRFDFDVPADVKRFLEAVQGGGAPLALLTKDVKLWLEQRGAFDDYQIRAVAR
jgi:hypothetical protein